MQCSIIYWGFRSARTARAQRAARGEAARRVPSQHFACRGPTPQPNAAVCPPMPPRACRSSLLSSCLLASHSRLACWCLGVGAYHSLSAPPVARMLPIGPGARRDSFMYIGSPNGPIQRLKPVRYAQYECYETTARSETRKLARVRPARCPA
jgi:hypothetical protein